MLDFLKPKASPSGSSVTFTVSGMHCTSCAFNIDDALEETKGITHATTSYQKSQTKIDYDPTLVTPDKIQKTIESLGYTATVNNS